MSVFFEVVSRLGPRIRVSEERWQLIVTAKHPVIKSRERDVELALIDPDEVRKSRSDFRVHLYYRRIDSRWICVVVKNDNGTGFVITAYLTDRIKEGNLLWRK